MFNILGGLIWIAGITYLGYFLGKLMHGLGLDIDTILLPIVGLILFVSVAPAIYHLLKDKKQRESIWEATKVEWKKIIERKK